MKFKTYNQKLAQIAVDIFTTLCCVAEKMKMLYLNTVHTCVC